MKKKVLSILLTITLLLCGPVPVRAAAPDAVTAGDIIDSGPLYDEIVSLCPCAALSVDPDDGTLTCDLSYYSSTSEYTLAGDYFKIVLGVIGSEAYSDDKRDIYFFAMTDSYMAQTGISKFVNLADFTSTFFSTPVGEEKTATLALELVYQNLFYNHDATNKYNFGLNEIAKEQGLSSYDPALTKKPEDALWAQACFGSAKTGKGNVEGTYGVNYRVSGDKRKYGYDVRYDIERAAYNMTSYMITDPSLISSNKLVIICFDGDTDTHLFEFTYTRKADNSWEAGVFYLDSEFEQGVRTANDEISNS